MMAIGHPCGGTVQYCTEEEQADFEENEVLGEGQGPPPSQGGCETATPNTE